MPQSLAQILVHVVFSTKHRQPMLVDGCHDDLHAYIGGIVTHHRGVLFTAGSVADHVHLLLAHPRTCAPSTLVQEIKTGSCKWLRASSPSMRLFSWQSGYGAFSISPSHRAQVERYLANQAEHHRTVTFQEEYRRLLAVYQIEHDERYVWD